MAQYQPCPNCASETAEPIGFTWWGGVVGPKIFNHVKCTQCGTTYNGKTGKSNQQAIVIYLTVTTTIAIVIIMALSPSRNSDRNNSPSTSSGFSNYLDRAAIATLPIVDR